jgi:hypothetical protein
MERQSSMSAAWQYVFPSDRLSTDRRSGMTHRHHLDPSGLQRVVKAAATLMNLLN